jgi:hypothetical protein
VACDQSRDAPSGPGTNRDRVTGPGQGSHPCGLRLPAGRGRPTLLCRVPHRALTPMRPGLLIAAAGWCGHLARPSHWGRPLHTATVRMIRPVRDAGSQTRRPRRANAVRETAKEPS